MLSKDNIIRRSHKGGCEMYKILFLCIGNSARSQMAEAVLNKFGKGKYEAYSAGSELKEEVDYFALKVLEKSDYDISQLSPKHMMNYVDDEFDFIITLCDKMKENCPVLPGKPIYAHWGMPDPVLFEGTEKEIYDYFSRTLQEISNRIHLFLNVKFEKRERLEIEKELGEIAMTWKYLR